MCCSFRNVYRGNRRWSIRIAMMMKRRGREEPRPSSGCTRNNVRMVVIICLRADRALCVFARNDLKEKGEKRKWTKILVPFVVNELHFYERKSWKKYIWVKKEQRTHFSVNTLFPLPLIFYFVTIVPWSCFFSKNKRENYWRIPFRSRK